MEKIILIGAGGHAKTIVDTIERLGNFEIAGFISEGEIGEVIYRGYSIIAHDENACDVYNMGVRYAFIAIGYLGNSNLREKLYGQYSKIGFKFPVIIDPCALVARDVVIDYGSYIGRNAVINANARIGKCCIVNTAAIIEHECDIEDFTHVAVGAVICGQTKLGKSVLIGANATVLQGVEIADNSVIGASVFVNKTIKEKTKLVAKVGNEETI